MASWPSGTVTFLFTDIEGSTRLAQSHPAAWPAARTRHHTILQNAIDSHGGRVFQTSGDAFCAAFHTAPDALAAALDAQRALHAEAWGDLHVRVRIGIHTGAATALAGGNYEGYLTLARAHRIMSAAYGGQTLLSRDAHELLYRDLPANLALRDVGTQQLKDLATPEQLYELVAPGLPADFPPLRTGDQPNNLPTQLTSFIGRETEVAEARRLLSNNRLLSMTGAGGVGKTRLALQVAASELDAFPDGVWFIELAPLVDPALIPHSLAFVAGVHNATNRPALDALGDHFRAKRALILLDNCEHLIAGAAHVCDALLHTAPHLSILATSREPLGIAGEQTYRVPSLAIPEGGEPLDVLAHMASIQLFAERAQAVKSDFAVNSAHAAAVAQICRRLDGIPLAIELAAARVRALSPEQIAARLDDRFHLLTSGSRTALPRQQTLRAAVDWSYSLLTDKERVLLRRLAVFAGGWALEAAEAVCGEDGFEASDVLDVLTGLVDKSLVTIEQRGDVARYQMLETIRQYAREKLTESGEASAVRTRHLEYYVTAVVGAVPQGDAFVMGRWNRILDSNKDNLNAALDWSIAGGTAARASADPTQTPPALGLHLAAELGWYWYFSSYWTEGADMLQRLISHPANAAASADRARALNALGHLQAMLGQLTKARTNLEEALQYGGRTGDQLIAKHAVEFLAYVTESQGNHAEARALLERSATLAGEVGDQQHRCWALISMGEGLFLHGELTHAQQLLEEAIALLRALGDRSILALALRRMAQVRLAQGDAGDALLLGRESLALNVELNEPKGTALSLATLGGVAATVGLFESAARLLGAATSFLDAFGITWMVPDRAFFDTSIGKVRTALPPIDLHAAWNVGRAMTLEQAVAETEQITALSPASAPAALNDNPAGLTAREVEVLRLLTQGLTDAQIAEQLVVSIRTVNSHLRAIYGKLAVTTRTAAVRAAIDLKLT